jgi:hypothetical protein
MGGDTRASRERPGGAAWRLLLVLGVVVGGVLHGVPVRAQAVNVVAEQVLVGVGSGGLVSANLDPSRRYTLQVLPAPDGSSFRGTYSQNWFTRDGVRRAGSGEGVLYGRAPWEQELIPPAPALVQWTFAALVWNETGGTLVIRLVDHGPR